jgi:hypothetical protein
MAVGGDDAADSVASGKVTNAVPLLVESGRASVGVQAIGSRQATSRPTAGDDVGWCEEPGAVAFEQAPRRIAVTIRPVRTHP